MAPRLLIENEIEHVTGQNHSTTLASTRVRSRWSYDDYRSKAGVPTAARGEKGTHGEERNQMIRNPSEGNKQDRCWQVQNKDAVGVNEPPASVGESAGKITILGDRVTHSGKSANAVFA